MIRNTATNKVMSVLSKYGKDWSKPYDEWNELHRQRGPRQNLIAKDLEILENDYALLESASLRLDKFTHIGNKDSNIGMQELKRISVCSEENKAKYAENRRLVLEELLSLNSWRQTVIRELR